MRTTLALLFVSGASAAIGVLLGWWFSRCECRTLYSIGYVP